MTQLACITYNYKTTLKLQIHVQITALYPDQQMTKYAM